MKAINIMLASKDEIEPMSEETAQEFNKMLNKYRRGILKDIENYFKLNVMNKEEAKEKLRRAESNLRLAEIISEEHEQAIKEIKEDIEKLTAIIDKKDDWRGKLVDPEIDKHFYISVDITSRYGVDWLKPMSGCNRNATLLFKEKSHAQLLADKIQLMQEMYAFAHVRNEGWVPDWKDENRKWGLITDAVEGIYLYSFFYVNPFIFGITVKSEEIAQEMLEEFGERIEEIYNKQY